MELDKPPHFPDLDPPRQIAFLLRIIVVAIGLAFCFFASSFCITIVLSILLAILIDPLMAALGRVVPSRIVAAGTSVLLVVALMAAVTFALYRRADYFAGQLPNYSYRIQKALSPFAERIERLQEGAEDLNPAKDSREPVVTVKEAHSWPSFLLRGAGPISSSLGIAVVAPFLAFFMLLRKEQMYGHFNTFFDRRIDTARFVAKLKGMVQAYILGNLIIGVVLSGATATLFLVMGMQNAIPLGTLCGFVNLVPFVGVILSTMMALAAALVQFDSVGPFIAIALAVPILHLVAINYLIPRLLGPRLLIGPIATTVGMLFWGWLWGIMGLLLAVPLTAFVKLVTDSHPRLANLSSLLASEPGPVPSWLPVGHRILRRVRARIKSFGSEGSRPRREM